MSDREAIRRSMAAHLGLPVERLSDAARFAEDLELDSFKMLTLPIALEVDWSIEFENDPTFSAVGQLIDAVEAHRSRRTNEVIPFTKQRQAPDDS